ERVGDGRRLGRQAVGQREELLGGHRREVRPVGVRARERLVAVQQVLITQVLEAVEAQSALAAREDRAQEHSPAPRDARRELRLRPRLFEDPDRLVAADAREGRAWIAVEEGPGVRAADPARRDPQDRALWIELWLLGVAEFDGIHGGHERGSHAAPPNSSWSASNAFSADQRSRITRASARVMASGESCMKMLRPTEHPI